MDQVRFTHESRGKLAMRVAVLREETRGGLLLKGKTYGARKVIVYDHGEGLISERTAADFHRIYRTIGAK